MQRMSGPAAVGGEDFPEVAWIRGSGRYLVVWRDNRDLFLRGTDMYQRLVGPGGSPAAPERRVTGRGGTVNEFAPAVACDGRRSGCLVVWEDYRDEYNRGSEIMGRRVGIDGKFIGGDFRVSRVQVHHEYNPAVVWNQTAGEFLVVWTDERDIQDATRRGDVYGRRVRVERPNRESRFETWGIPPPVALLPLGPLCRSGGIFPTGVGETCAPLLRARLDSGSCPEPGIRNPEPEPNQRPLDPPGCGPWPGEGAGVGP